MKGLIIMTHPIQGLMEASMKNIKEMIDVNTIIGEPVQTPDGTTIIPVSKVAFGFGAGDSDIPVKGGSGAAETPFGGGSGAGVSIKPVGFLVVGTDQIKLLPIDTAASTPVDKLLEFIPQMIDKVNNIVKEKKDKKENTTEL